MTTITRATPCRGHTTHTHAPGVSLQPACPSGSPWPTIRREQTMQMQWRKESKLPKKLSCSPPRTSTYPGLVINKAQSISLEARLQNMRCLKEGLHTRTVQLITNSESSQVAGSVKGLSANKKAGHTWDYPILEDRLCKCFRMMWNRFFICLDLNKGPFCSAGVHRDRNKGRGVFS